MLASQSSRIAVLQNYFALENALKQACHPLRAVYVWVLKVGNKEPGVLPKSKPLALCEGCACPGCQGRAVNSPAAEAAVPRGHP